MEEKIYTCECGKTFTKPNSFNGHKSGCKQHMLAVGKLESLQERNTKLSVKQKQYQKQERIKREQLNEISLKLWVEEQHRCEHCGKIMTQKFASGRFCSKSCANYRSHNSQTILKIKENVINSEKFSAHLKEIQQKKHEMELEYYNNPNHCIICGSSIPYNIKDNQTCGESSCYNKLLSIRRSAHIEEHGYNLNVTVKSRYKYGTYNGVSCDSSWELAFVLYNIDHNISFTRNRTDYFEYIYDDKKHRFYPDFLVDDTYVEIKNGVSDLTNAKVSCIPSNIKFKILYEADMKTYIDYVKITYGEDFYTMYDRNYPSWMDNIVL